LQTAEIKAACGKRRHYATCTRQSLSHFCMDKL